MALIATACSDPSPVESVEHITEIKITTKEAPKCKAGEILQQARIGKHFSAKTTAAGLLSAQMLTECC